MHPGKGPSKATDAFCCPESSQKQSDFHQSEMRGSLEQAGLPEGVVWESWSLSGSVRDGSKNPVKGSQICAEGRKFQKVRSPAALQPAQYRSRQKPLLSQNRRVNKGQIAWTNEVKIELSCINSKGSDLRLLRFTFHHSSDSQHTFEGASKQCC